MAKAISLRSRLTAELIGTLFFVFLAAGSIVSAAYLEHSKLSCNSIRGSYDRPCACIGSFGNYGSAPEAT